MRYPYLRFIILFITLSQLSACAHLKLTQAQLTKAEQLGFKTDLIHTQHFIITGLSAQKENLLSPMELVTYIEGDGRSWINRDTVSNNPTPLNPFALQLAMSDSRRPIVYLARPCQYTPHNIDKNCNPDVWTHSRYSKQAVQATSEAIDFYKSKFKLTNRDKIHLIGYSGGGGIAALVAAIRQDVKSLITVAADLDTAAMQAYHHTTHLTNSENPLDVAEKINNIPQCHFSGELDKTVPPHIAGGFIKKMTIPNCAEQFIQPKANHYQGWIEHWPLLINQKLKCTN